MGMGRALKNFVLSNLVRPFKNFNVESRAHRLIEKKSRAAPKHPGPEEFLTGFVSRRPRIQEEILKKDDGLLSRLKEVYVDSTDPLSEAKREVQSSESEEFRPAKQEKTNIFLNVHVDRIPKGKISLTEALTLLNNHKQAPKEWTAEKIAEEYNLNVQDSQALLEYFRMFTFEIISREKIADH